MQTRKSKRKDCCPSCDVPYIAHLGLIGTCAKLRVAMKALKKISEMNGQGGTRQAAFMALAAIKAMP